jgi:hypothetical protein
MTEEADTPFNSAPVVDHIADRVVSLTSLFVALNGIENDAIRTEALALAEAVRQTISPTKEAKLTSIPGGKK